jgi:lipoprotein-anchoring transpeptidase ErfK/SrfK
MMPWLHAPAPKSVGAALLGVICLGAATACSATHQAARPAGGSTAMRVLPTHRTAVAPTALVALKIAHRAYSRPSTRTAPLERVSAVRPLTGERTTLPVLGQSGHGSSAWLHVLLPGRPNGHAGWIAKRGTVGRVTRWRIDVHLSARRVTVLRAGRVMRTARAVVGKPSTPTPRGRFFVEKVIALPPSAVGAPFALALSARSNVFQVFDGGPGEIALHGLMNVGGTLGTASSHGCVRLDNGAMRWLVKRIRPGTPVTIAR